jgi:hypothetical protein
VLNQHDVSYVWTHLAGLATLGLSLFCVWIISLAVARPADPSSTETLGQKVKGLITGAPAPQRPVAPSPTVDA